MFAPQAKYPLNNLQAPPHTRLAYILLWFPKPSETFIFREVVNLLKMGLNLQVFSLFGSLTRHLSPEMKSLAPQVERLGLPSFIPTWKDFLYWWRRRPSIMWRLIKRVLPGKWRHPERELESLWGAFCGLHLARRFQEERITHIHAPWACGPATAAWVASQLTGIPYSFTGRAHDVFTPDSLLRQKIEDAAFVRVNSRAALNQLYGLAGQANGKLRLTYNGAPLTTPGWAPVPMQPPYRLLSLGRFVETKGFDYLIRACRILKDQGIAFHLTLAGEGPKERQLKHLAREMGLASLISFPGFIPHHLVPGLFLGSDIFIMPSVVHGSGDSDGIPNVILEALLNRLPVIATHAGGIGELIEDGVTGVAIPQRDPQAIAAAVTQVIGRRDAALAMAAEGQSRVLRDFNPETNHRRVLELFLEYGRHK